MSSAAAWLWIAVAASILLAWAGALLLACLYLTEEFRRLGRRRAKFNYDYLSVRLDRSPHTNPPTKKNQTK
jgi:hypothetical protein